MTFATTLLLVCLILLAITVLGRLIIATFNINLLKALTCSNAAASALLGTGVAILGFGWLSYAGLPGKTIVTVLSIVFVLLLAYVLVRRRFGIFKPRGPVVQWLCLLGACLTAATMALMPMLRANSYDPLNDSLFYCCHSDWLQDHGFGTPVSINHPLAPIEDVVYHFQAQLPLRMGPNFFLAFVQAASGASCSMLVYPAVGATGLVLTELASFLCARWVLRLPAAVALAGCFVFALLPHPLLWGVHHGFLAQIYGLPALLFGIAALSRLVPRWRWSAPMGGVLALAGAFLLSVYSELFAVLAVIGLWYVFLGLRYARRRHLLRRWALFLGWTTLLFVGFANIELTRSYQAIRLQLTNVVGFNIPWPKVAFVDWYMGTRVEGVETERFKFLLDGYTRFTVTYLGFMAAGILQVVRHRRGSWVLVALAVFLALTAYYSLLSHDPWTEKRGHTWNLFKLGQWAYPLVLLFQLTGLMFLGRALRIRAAGLMGAWLVLALLMSCLHWGWSSGAIRNMRQIISSDQPMADLPLIQRRLHELPGNVLYLADRVGGEDRSYEGYAGYVALLAYPRPIRGNFRNCYYVEYVPELWAEPPPPEEGDTIILWGEAPPYQKEGIKDLGGGFFWITTKNPWVMNVVNPNGIEKNAERRPFFWVGGEATEIYLFSPKDMEVDLALEVVPGLSLPGIQRRTLLVVMEGVSEEKVELIDYPVWRLPLKLKAGTNVLKMASPDAPSSPALPDGDNRPLLLGVANITISPKGS